MKHDSSCAAVDCFTSYILNLGDIRTLEWIPDASVH